MGFTLRFFCLPILLKLQLLRRNVFSLLPLQTRFKLQNFPSCKRKDVSPQIEVLTSENALNSSPCCHIQSGGLDMQPAQMTIQESIITWQHSLLHPSLNRVLYKHRDMTPFSQWKATRSHKMFNLWQNKPHNSYQILKLASPNQKLALLESGRDQVFHCFQSNSLGRICF